MPVRESFGARVFTRLVEKSLTLFLFSFVSSLPADMTGRAPFGVSIVQGEVSLLLSATRRGSRWTNHGRNVCNFLCVFEERERERERE